MEYIPTIKDLVLIAVAFYTAWWARKTFAHKDKVDELKEILIVIEKIRQEAFFNLQLKSTDGKRKPDLTDMIGLTFDFQVKVGSALYLNDEVIAKAYTMSQFIQEKLLPGIIEIDGENMADLRRTFGQLQSSLKSSVKSQVGQYR